MNSDALIAALVELEHHVAEAGWDQPARLFALVRTDDLIVAEPQLAEHLGLHGSADGLPADALSSVEQDDFRSVGAAEAEGQESESDLPRVLARIAWPDAVQGCALALERSFLPAQFENDLPDDPIEAGRVVARHPERQDLRLVAGVLRDGASHALARLARQPDDLLSGTELAPGVVSALAATLDHAADAGDAPLTDAGTAPVAEACTAPVTEACTAPVTEACTARQDSPGHRLRQDSRRTT